MKNFCLELKYSEMTSSFAKSRGLTLNFLRTIYKPTDMLALNYTAAQQRHHTTATSKYETLDVQIEKGICRLKFNRPDKKNAVNMKMYEEIPEALKEAGDDENVVICYVTGAGDYYSSGNDLSNFIKYQTDNPADLAKRSRVILRNFVAAIIDFPKPLIAGLNGPAIGIAATPLGLFDTVYASDRATLHCPFSALGQSPEGCSSYTFPRIMGQAKASELLLFNKKITANQAFDLGLVTEVFPHDRFHSEVELRLQRYSQFPKQSMILSKRLIRGFDKETLHRVNEMECELLEQLWQSEECMNAILQFFSRHSKL